MKKKTDYLTSEDTAIFFIVGMSVLGDRDEQEDCFGYDIREKKAIITVCDGMGGHRGGKLASNTAVNYILDTYRKNIDNASMNTEMDSANTISFLHKITNEADYLISNLRDDNGNMLNAGSTMVTVIIDGNTLFWSSVGDSRLYILRNGEFIQVTVDHNYREYLKEQFLNHEISKEEFVKESKKGDALLCYLGVNGLQLIDYNIEPFHLVSDDVIVIVSDGLYKVLSSQEMSEEIEKYRNDIKKAVVRLNEKSEKKAKKYKVNRDNTTVVLIKVK